MTSTSTGILPAGQRAHERKRDSDDRPHASVQDVKEDVAQLRHDVAEYASDATRTGIDAVKAGASHLAETGKKAGHTMQETHEKMCGYVSAHPTTSVLIAAGVGALLARVLPRR